MKFYGEPNLTVFTNKKQGFVKVKVKLLQFDEKGEFETKDKTLIEKLKPHYKYERGGKNEQ